MRPQIAVLILALALAAGAATTVKAADEPEPEPKEPPKEPPADEPVEPADTGTDTRSDAQWVADLAAANNVSVWKVIKATALGVRDYMKVGVVYPKTGPARDYVWELSETIEELSPLAKMTYAAKALAATSALLSYAAKELPLTRAEVEQAILDGGYLDEGGMGDEGLPTPDEAAPDYSGPAPDGDQGLAKDLAYMWGSEEAAAGVIAALREVMERPGRRGVENIKPAAYFEELGTPALAARWAAAQASQLLGAGWPVSWDDPAAAAYLETAGYLFG